jgi:hypothetical protein
MGLHGIQARLAVAILGAGLSAGCTVEDSEVGAINDPLPTPRLEEKNLPMGAMCPPTDEWFPQFSGYSVSEVTVLDAFDFCASAICVVDHFSGRRSCPYGQAAPENEQQFESPACLLPDGRARVSVAVVPQVVGRPPEDTMYCSCRCAGPGPGPFCSCPAGFECRHLIDDVGLNADHAGSYCMKPGPAFDGQYESCDWSKKNCGPG